MALTDFKPQFDNSYQEIFNKVLVGKRIANLRFEPVLKYGESVERVLPDISAVQVRTVTRGSASTIDSITDSSELLTINLEKEAVFHISDGEVKQAGPLNPGEVLGAQVAIKVASDLDANILYEATSALYDFDTGDLTTGTSTGVPFALDATNTPLAITRMKAKLRAKNNQTLTNLVWVIDSFAAADLEQYLLGKSIDLAGAVFQNGYAGTVSGAEIIISENKYNSVNHFLKEELKDYETHFLNIGDALINYRCIRSSCYSESNGITISIMYNIQSTTSINIRKDGQKYTVKPFYINQFEIDILSADRRFKDIEEALKSHNLL